MPKVDYTTTIDVPLAEVWDFVRDMNNWAPFVKGYLSHEVLNDRESLWNVKADVGPLSKATKARVDITEWVDGERVAFTLKALEDPIKGAGVIQLREARAGAGTEIRGEATLEFGGMMGPIVNRLIGPLVRDQAEELVTKIVAAVQERSGQKQ